MLLVAHNNIISYYNIDKKDWKNHHKFDNQQGMDSDLMSINTTFAYSSNKVLKVFRYQTKDSS